MDEKNKKCKKCNYCEKELEPRAVKQVFCSVKCRQLSQRKRVIKVCEECGKSFEVKFYRNADAKYCSMSCGSKNSSLAKSAKQSKYSLEYVEQCFTTRGCQLLSKEYKNYHSPLKYQCKCGNITTISLANLKGGQRCRRCAGKEVATLNEMRDYFAMNGCELLDTYINHYAPLKFRCKCGKISKRTWYHFQKTPQCTACSGKAKPDISKLQAYYKSQNCELLDTTYISAKHKLKYQCSCGRISQSSWTNFRKGKRCGKCQETQGERAIANYLQTNNYLFKREASFSSCCHKRPLAFDFLVKTPEYGCLIEFQGQQHYFPCAFGSNKNKAAIRNLIGNVIRDEKKRLWCQSRDIKLLKIPYWEIKETTKILDNFFAGKVIEQSKAPPIIERWAKLRLSIINKVFST